MKYYTALCLLENKRYKSIVLDRRIVKLSRTNRFSAACHICHEVQKAGGMVWQKMYGQDDFICFPCLKRMILLSKRGFNVDGLKRLTVALYIRGKYSSEDIANSLRVYWKRRDPKKGLILIPDHRA